MQATIQNTENQTVTYKIPVRKFVTDINGNQVEVQPQYCYLTRDQLNAQMVQFQQMSSLCDEADKTAQANLNVLESNEAIS